MALKQFSDKQVIHEKGSPCTEYEVVLKGAVTCLIGEKTLEFTPGSILGLSENEGEPYRCKYMAEGDTVIYGYPAKGAETVENIIHVNQKIAPQMASAAVRNAADFCDAAIEYRTYALKRKQEITDHVKEYLSLCATIRKKPLPFPKVMSLIDPPETAIPNWEVSFLNTFVEYDDRMKQQIYVLGPDMCTGIVMTAHTFIAEAAKQCDETGTYIAKILDDSAAFRKEFEDVTDIVKSQRSAAATEEAIAGGNIPSFENAPASIVSFSGIPKEGKDEFFELWKQYKAVPDRSDTSDDLRKLRRKLTAWFYKIYEGIFFNAIQSDDIPIEVKMFLMTGFFDKEIAGEQNTEKLFNFVVQYLPDPDGQVFTIYEWLMRIYAGKNEPSRNEFDMDYPASLRDRKMNGEITEAMEKKLLHDKKEKTRFEMKNLFELGNRMTFGRISVFFPFFDSVNAMLPLEKCYISADRIREELANLKKLDFRCFYREDIYSNEELGITQIVVHHEYQPYFIMMPNVGSRSVLWQEIEGKRRSTHSRMLMPLFNMEELPDAMAEVCGEFRWEMCKTEQGVHWNDLSDPSLTAEYSDYLQYYKKNSSLTPEYREKVKKALQKASNNFRRVFVQDYLTYIKFESRGALRLNKVARGIIFTYCPFAKELREELGANPQYQQLIAKMKNKVNQQARPILNIISRMKQKDEEVPKELLDEIEFFKM